MKNSTKAAIVFLTVIEVLAALLLFNLLSEQSSAIQLGAVAGVIIVSLGVDAALLHGNSASVVSDAKKLKDADDYIRAFNAWLSEGTPFDDQIKIAVKQLESLKRKQKALRSVLDDSKDSPFLSVARDVDSYVLANSKRVLNRVMIYDQGEPHKYNMHVAFLQEVLGENAHVLSDFENLILEVSQIGDDTAAATPCLNELTTALRSVRHSNDDIRPQTEQPQQMRSEE